MICSIPNCTRNVQARGLCASHYAVANHRGEFKNKRTRIMWGSLQEKFNAYFMPIDYTGCWLWMGSFFQSGYGQITDPGKSKNRKANRVAWELYRGEIPDGMSVLHKCDNRWCVNPDHLFLGTHKVNMADMVSKRRQAFGVGHGMAKLTEDDVVEILKSNDGCAELGRRFNVTDACVHRIKKRLSWRHISI